MRTLGNLYRHILAAEIYWIEDVVGGRGKMFAELDNGQTRNRIRDLAVDRSPTQVTGNGGGCDCKFWRFAIDRLCRK